MLRMNSLALIICLLLPGCMTAKKKTPDSTDGLPPKLLAPNVRKIWVPAALKNGGIEWEEGHYIYRIERGATWSR